MSFKCCLFKLKKDELSSYYINELNQLSNYDDPVKENLNKQNNESANCNNNNNNTNLNNANKEGAVAEAAVATAVQSDKNDAEKQHLLIETKDKNLDESNNLNLLSKNENFLLDANKTTDNVSDEKLVNSKTDSSKQIANNANTDNNKTLKNSNNIVKRFSKKYQSLDQSNNNPQIDENNYQRQFSLNNNPSSSNNNNNNINQQTAASSGSMSSTNQPVYYELEVCLKEGKSLAIRDSNGFSDPYAKFLLNGSNVYKSKIIYKNLNPQWNEKFTIKLMPSSLKGSNFGGFSSKSAMVTINESASLISTLDHAEQLEYFLSKFKLKMFVYDYDRGFLSDDLIGYAAIDLTNLKENTETSIELELEDEKQTKPEYLGKIFLDLNLVPKYSLNEKDASNISTSNTPSKLAHSVSSSSQLKPIKRAPYQLWQSVLNVVLVEGNNLISMDDNGFSDPYVKFKLENEKYRSKTIRRTLNPKYLEQFQFYIYDNDKMNLHISVYDYDAGTNSDDFMGRAILDLKNYEVEKTHFVKLPLEDGAGTISLLFTITGIYSKENTDTDKDASSQPNHDEIIRKYGIVNSLKETENVGWLQVKVNRAEGLASADINGKSDPFVALQLVNQYAQTHTEYKTLNPEWGKTFEFIISDLHAVLEVTVLDEDKNKVYEFLGKIEIPIINIQNGKKKWYVLKDRKLIGRSKGIIELEMNLFYNPIKAVLKTFNPREEKIIPPESKLKIPVLKQNIMRVHNLVQGIINTGNFIDSCFRWVDPIRSIIAFISFIIIVLCFQIYMLPLTLLMIFLKNYVILKMKEMNSSSDEDDISFEFVDEEEEQIDDAKEEPKKSFREKLNEIQEICLRVQETLDYIASMGERVVNTFTFTSPWLSWLAIIVLIIVSIILYAIPLRYLILAWGVNKFTKKFRKPPDYVDNTEILDFLSRVPSKKELFYFRELRVEKNIQNATQNSSSATNTKEKKKKK